MEQKRLFIGGLYQGITEKDVQERFGRFGKVSSVEIKEKQSVTGEHQKTFAYINLQTDCLQKCISTFNNSKWKGQVLRIQPAVESFLDKLKTEQSTPAEEAAPVVNIEREAPSVASQTFKAKKGAAIAGERNWVVDKFGKGVPVVFIRRKDKQKVMKVDPTAFTKTLKKFKADDINMVGSDLTWKLPKKNTASDRKKRGIFPTTPNSQKCSVNTASELDNSIDVSNERKATQDQKDAENELMVVSASDTIATNALFRSLSHNSSAQVKEDGGYDSAGSADTDEILSKSHASGRKSISHDVPSKADISKPGGTLTRSVSINYDLSTGYSDENKTSSSVPISKAGVPQKGQAGVPQKGRKSASIDEVSPKSMAGGKECLSTKSHIKSHIKASKKKKDEAHLKAATMAESKTPDEALKSTGKEDVQEVSSKSCEPLLSDPEFAFLFESDSDDTDNERSKKKKKRNKAKVTIPEFTGTKTICDYHSKNVASDFHMVSCVIKKKIATVKEKSTVGEVTAEKEGMPSVKKQKVVNHDSLDSDNPQAPKTLDTNDLEIVPVGKVNNKMSKQNNDVNLSRFDSDSDSNEEVQGGKDVAKLVEQDKAKTSKHSLTVVNTATTATTEKQENEMDNSEKVGKKRTKKKEKGEKTPQQKKDDKKMSSDRKRLETMKERQQENKAKSDAIKKALSAVDSEALKNKRVVFDSDSEDETPAALPKATEKIKVQKESIDHKKAGLFDSDSSEDESEEDKEMFKIKPQFEGKKGQKLMSLQSRFQSDDRFKLTEHFMESGSEEEAEMPAKEPEAAHLSEKDRSIEILKGLVGSEALKGKTKKEKKKTFIDAIHFDPSKEEHNKLQLEREPTEKKVKKRKKKDMEPEADVCEPEVLPEVSGEKFFQVAAPLKSIFGQGNESAKFSFLESDDEDKEPAGRTNEGEVKAIEAAGGPVMPWEKTFKYESSEDEDEHEERMDTRQESSVEPAPIKMIKSTFFFQEDDPRIKEGLQFFRRPDTLENIREKWEECREDRIEGYRTKHKKALRRNKTVLSLKNKPYQRKQGRN